MGWVSHRLFSRAARPQKRTTRRAKNIRRRQASESRAARAAERGAAVQGGLRQCPLQRRACDTAEAAHRERAKTIKAASSRRSPGRAAPANVHFYAEPATPQRQHTVKGGKPPSRRQAAESRAARAAPANVQTSGARPSPCPHVACIRVNDISFKSKTSRLVG
jgi:hypothetical protein